MSFLRNAFKDYEENKKGEYEGYDYEELEVVL